MASSDNVSRSKLHPACVPCRQRKSRCNFNVDADICLSCQTHNTKCVMPDLEPRRANTTTMSRPSHKPGTKRKRISPTNDELITDAQTSPRSVATNIQMNPTVPRPDVAINQIVTASLMTRSITTPSQSVLPHKSLAGNLLEGDESISHVVDPMSAFDNDILEKYLSVTSLATTSDRSVQNGSTTFQTADHAASPVMFNTIPQRPMGISDRQSLAANKCEIVERMIGLELNCLVDVHFDIVNACCPLLDRDNFRTLHRDFRSSMSPALLANLYACTVPYWSCSKALAKHRPPDGQFLWVQANESLYSELFLAPGMSVIIATLLNVCGRPSTSMLGNGGLIGYVISLAYGLGLNRNPRPWNIPQPEKSLRIRIWWLIVVLDKWSSLAYGTPPRIQWSVFDVPYPTLAELDVSNCDSSISIRNAVVFYSSFLSLSEVLSRYLDHVYSLDNSTGLVNSRVASNSDDLDMILTRWEETLNDPAREVILHSNGLDAMGAASLRLAYLGVKLFLCKIQLDLEIKSQHSPSDSNHGTKSWRFMQCQRVAEDIVFFVKQLRDHQLRGYWFPLCAFALTSATTFLLRSAVKTSHSEPNMPLRVASDMLETLQRYRSEFNWDLADNCLRCCTTVLEKMSKSSETGTEAAQPSLEGFSINQWDFEDMFPDIWGMLET